MHLLKNVKVILISCLVLLVMLMFIMFSHLRGIQLQLDDSNLNFPVLYLIFVVIIAVVGVAFYLAFAVWEENKTCRARIDKLESAVNAGKEVPETKAESRETDDETMGEEYIDAVLPDIKKHHVVEKYSEQLLKNLGEVMEVVQGMVYLKKYNEQFFVDVAKYAYFGEQAPENFELGVTIPGQVAKNKKKIILNAIPESQMKVVSGLGESSPANLVVFPVVQKEETIAVIELASFKPMDEKKELFIDKLAEELKKPMYSFYQKTQSKSH